MKDILANATGAILHARPAARMRVPDWSASRLVGPALVLAASFGLYWFSSFLLQARHAITHFGADAHIYTLLAQGIVNDRLARFHPTTIAMALGWMKITSPLATWVAPAQLLKAMFAAIGAVGALAAMSAFAAVMPRRYAILFGIVYAVSLGVWYCSSIEESKIVTASLSALYIATYLHLRTRWTARGALLLTAILLTACLNELVCCFLVAIPVVDALMQRGWDLRHGRWIVAHGLAVPVAFAILEFVVKGRLVDAGTDPNEASHLSLLIAFVSNNDYSAASLYAFVVDWLFFNIAAPSADASAGANLWLNFAGTFEPALTNYLASPVSAGVVVLASVIVVASASPRYRLAGASDSADILVALAAYALLRGAFFLIFNSREPLLNSPATTLPHLLLVGIPFTASSFPAKRSLLAIFAVLLFIANGAFIFGW
jgi:hypothetical protein